MLLSFLHGWEMECVLILGPYAIFSSSIFTGSNDAPTYYYYYTKIKKYSYIRYLPNLLLLLHSRRSTISNHTVRSDKCAQEGRRSLSNIITQQQKKTKTPKQQQHKKDLLLFFSSSSFFIIFFLRSSIVL